MKSTLEIYALSVCFAAIICLVVSTGTAGYAFVEIFDPELTISSFTYERCQSNDQFWQYSNRFNVMKDQNSVTRPPEEELTQKRLKETEIALTNEKRNGFQNLIHSTIFFLIGAVTLFLHWRIAKKARASKGA